MNRKPDRTLPNLETAIEILEQLEYLIDNREGETEFYPADISDGYPYQTMFYVGTEWQKGKPHLVMPIQVPLMTGWLTRKGEIYYQNQEYPHIKRHHKKIELHITNTLRQLE